MLLRRSLSSALTVGIRREDPQRIWERRAPLTPNGVAKLVERGVSVEIEPCDRRVFRDAEYTAAGANIVRTLANAHVILGIKEPPLDEVLTSGVVPPAGSYWHERGYTAVPRTHLMFSHTAKGQPYNTPLLAKFVVPDGTPGAALRPRLIDYELLTDEHGKRTVGFGWFAGFAGVLESLASMAQSHLEKGIATPFIATPRPHTHRTLQSIRAALCSIGEQIAHHGVPAALGPFVIGLTGNGNVARGCLDILSELPLERVSIPDLHALVTDPTTSLNKIYLAHALPQDYLARTDGGTYTREHYYAHPSSYRSTFSTTIAPYLTLLLNATGWTQPYPRLMTTASLGATHALARARGVPGSKAGLRFTNVGDISCDIRGGLEFLVRSTTLSRPFYKIRADRDHDHDTGTGTGTGTDKSEGGRGCGSEEVQMMAVDILPTTLPLDASAHFEAAVLPYLWSVLGGYVDMPVEGEGAVAQHRDALERATIARGGALVGRHGALRGGVDEFWAAAGAGTSTGTGTGTGTGVGVGMGAGAGAREQSVMVSGRGRGRERKKRIVLFGSGMVARPAVEVIAQRQDVQLVVAGNQRAELDALQSEFPNIETELVDVDEGGPTSAVSNLISSSEIAISLLPASYHPTLASHCLTHHTHLITASYTSPSLRALHTRAIYSNLLILNEMGLDPGLDHLSAMELIARVKARGEMVLSFVSFCGGLPAWEVGRGVPGGYKFSWNPRGVLLAVENAARWLVDGEVHEIAQGALLKNVFEDVHILPDLKLEGLANRDSIAYQEAYGVPLARTFFRGTLRYPGFSSLMESFRCLGLLDTSTEIYPRTWHAFVPLCIARQLGIIKSDKSNPERDPPRLPADAISRLVPPENVPALLDALEWLGLVPPSPSRSPSHTSASASAFAPAPRTSPALPATPTTPLTLLTTLLAHKLAYAPHEHDTVLLSHELITRDPKTRQERVYTSTLFERGTPRASAMARTVGVPVGVAALLVLDGEVGVRGVCGPVTQGVWGPVLGALERYGLGMTESVRVLGDGEGEDGNGNGNGNGTVEGALRRALVR